MNGAVTVGPWPPAEVRSGAGNVVHSDVLGGTWGAFKIGFLMTVLEMIKSMDLGHG